MEEAKYYAMMGSERVGPMTIDDLRNLGITPRTPVWRPGMADWADASTLPELSQCFAPQPPYHPYSQPQQGGYPPYNNGYNQDNNNNVLPPRPDNYLVWSIVVTILCCLIGGIVALVYSSKVNSAYDRGDYAASMSASNSAKTWCIVSAIIGLLGNAVYGSLIMMGAVGNILDAL